MRSQRGDRRALGLSLAAAGLAVACGGTDRADVVPDTVVVDLRVGADGIEIRDVQPLSRRRLVHHYEALTSLEYVLIDREGREVLRARMPDFRWGRSEAIDPDTGAMTRDDFRFLSAIGTIRLPAIVGELVILEPTAGGTVELGRAPFDPGAAAVSARRLPLDDDEILGEPVLIAGGGAKEGAIDVLLLPEAYKEDQLPEFHETAVRFAKELVTQPDFAAYADRLNVWYIDVRSDEDKLDSGGLFGDHYDSAFDGRWGGGGIVGIGDVPDNCTTYGEGDDARDLGDQYDMDMVAMVANVDGIRALAVDDMITMGRDNSGKTLAHELGHAILDLGDEYVEDSSGLEGFRCDTQSFFSLHDRANVQPDVEDLPWWDLLTPGVELPTPEDTYGEVVGAFEGARHCATGWYRPEHSCLMKSTLYEMCAVCRRELDRLMDGLSVEPASCPEEFRDDGLCDLCLGDDPDCEVPRVCSVDGLCMQYEHCSTCPEDCGSCAIGGGCGDGACAVNESDSSCPADCGCTAEGQCTNGPAPFGCYCDSACEENGDCCADADPTGCYPPASPG